LVGSKMGQCGVAASDSQKVMRKNKCGA